MNGVNRIEHIFKQLEAEVPSKQDFMIHPKDVRMNSNGQLVSRDRVLTHHVTDWALGQLASKTNSGLPIRYLRKCPTDLQAVNVNHWMQQFDYDQDNPWLFRTKTGDSNGLVRGILSEKYSPFDDHEIMAILNQFFGESHANIDIKWWHKEDTGFHLRVVFDDLTTQVGTTPDGSPDIHKVGLHIENSEVGKKSLRITPLVWRLVCSNGLMGWGANQEDMFVQRHVHLRPHEMYGRVAEAIGNALKVGDASIERLLQAKETPVINPLDVIKQLSEKNKYSKEFTEKVQGAFLQEEGNSAFYVVQAFTRACQDTASDFRVGVESDATKMLNDLIKTA
jgi:DNA-dependent RNA polymerase auxiliary subunit epsilon